MTTADPPVATGPVLAVFAESGMSGEAEDTRMLSTAGSLFARNGARIVCLVEKGAYCRPLVAAARAEEGEVVLLSDGSLGTDALTKSCTVETIEDEEARHQRLADLCDALVGFPVGIAGARAMFNVWVLAGAGAGGKPVALLNRNNAFEVLRGYMVDVVTHSLANSDRMAVFADSVEALWASLTEVLGKD